MLLHVDIQHRVPVELASLCVVTANILLTRYHGNPPVICVYVCTLDKERTTFFQPPFFVLAFLLLQYTYVVEWYGKIEENIASSLCQFFFVNVYTCIRAYACKEHSRS